MKCLSFALLKFYVDQVLRWGETLKKYINYVYILCTCVCIVHIVSIYEKSGALGNTQCRGHGSQKHCAKAAFAAPRLRGKHGDMVECASWKAATALPGSVVVRS